MQATLGHRALLALLAACGCLACDNGGTGPQLAGARDCCTAASCPAEKQCCTQAMCMQLAQLRLSEVLQPMSQALTDIACMQDHVEAHGHSATGAICECGFTTAMFEVGPVELGADCFVFGRAGDCLLDTSAFTGCTVGSDESCTRVCEELEARLADDAARTLSAELVHAACDDTSSCRDVLRIDDRCFADGSNWQGLAYDCALGGTNILEQHFADLQAFDDEEDASAR